MKKLSLSIRGKGWLKVDLFNHPFESYQGISSHASKIMKISQQVKNEFPLLNLPEYENFHCITP